jgi:hypothetical protein
MIFHASGLEDELNGLSATTEAWPVVQDNLFAAHLFFLFSFGVNNFLSDCLANFRSFLSKFSIHELLLAPQNSEERKVERKSSSKEEGKKARRQEGSDEFLMVFNR